MLPDRIVGKLRPYRGQPRIRTESQFRVSGKQISPQNPERGAIGNQVIQTDYQLVLAFRQLEEAHCKQGPLRH